jgi:hypothetical protein
MPTRRGQSQQVGETAKIEASKPQGVPSRRRVITILGAVAGLPLLLSADEPENPMRMHRWQGRRLALPPTS